MDGENDAPGRRQVTLPSLTADEALRFVALLETISRAIWCAYGEKMSELLISDPTRQGPTSFGLDDPLAGYDDSDLPF